MQPHEYGLTQALYGIDDTCEKLGIGRNAVYSLIHSGELLVKFGRKTMFQAPFNAGATIAISRSLQAGGCLALNRPRQWSRA